MNTVLLKTRIADATKQAMRAKDSQRLGALRLLSAAIKQREIDERRELNDTDIIAILEKQVKQRRESMLAFEQAARHDSAASERAEMAVLQAFLPQAASEQEVTAAIDAACASVAAQGITGPAAIGKIMAALKQALAGRADMAALAQQIKQRLSQDS